jgi:hypothetical protein
MFDDFGKSPDTALRCILRHCGVPVVRLIPQDLRALSANFLQSHLNYFLSKASGHFDLTSSSP